MDNQNEYIDSTTTTSIDPLSLHSHPTARFDPNETPTVNSTNPNYQPNSANTSHSWEKTNLSTTLEGTTDKAKTELKKGQQHVEDIITKSKRLIKQHWSETCHVVHQTQKKVKEMVPKQVENLIYWQNPIQSGVVFGVLLSVVITFMFLSSLAAISFWLIALLTLVGVYKLYNYVMATFLGRVHEDIFDSIFSADLNISERQAHALANAIRANGTMLLRQGRSLFLWNNLTNSILFGLLLFVFFYIGLSMNALTFALVGLIFTFTVPKIYQVYQVPIDRAAKQGLDQINQLLAKATSKGSVKPKKL